MKPQGLQAGGSRPATLTDQTSALQLADGTDATFVTQARLVRIGDRNILFSPSRRAMFALNDSAAEIWRALQEGVQRKTIQRRLANGGFDPMEASVETALDDWERLGLIRPLAPSPPASTRTHVSQVLAIAGRRIRIVYPVGIAHPTATVFAHLQVPGEAADVLLQAVQHRKRIHLFRNGVWLLSCPSAGLATALKGELLADALERADYELALHAAALLNGERLVLLCGQPGAGKTTLTLALAHAGFGFASDDVTLLNASGLGVGLPFAAAIKSGAWPLLAECCPDLDAVPIFRRPDNKRVRYVLPKQFSPASMSPRAVGWVILLRRDRNLSPSLDPVDPVVALRGLLNGAFAPCQELGSTAFDALAHIIGSAQAYCLTYSRLADAVELIRGACR